jgi:hypothetical protein
MYKYYKNEFVSRNKFASIEIYVQHISANQIYNAAGEIILVMEDGSLLIYMSLFSDSPLSNTLKM